MRISDWSSDVCSSDLAGRFAFPDALAHEGERLWKSDPGLRQMIPDLTTLAGLTPEVLAKSIGTTKADAVIAYLRRHPDVVIQQAPGSLAIARDKLAQSLDRKSTRLNSSH